jgi:ornithine cyclodeaminase/alanine dehydrogenase-like protein (mu-crystallin family)
MRILDADAVVACLPMHRAIEALDLALHSEAGLPRSEPRGRMAAPGGEVLLMPAAGATGTGVKVVSVAPGNPSRGLPLISGVYVLFSPETLQVEAIIDGPALTGIRTAAVSGWVTDRLALPDAHRVVVFGSGPQAYAHLDAMLAVREVDRVGIASRNAAGAERLAQHAAGRGVEAAVTTPDAVAEADLVCCCTSSSQPVFDGSLLTPGTHVNAIGSHTPQTRELDAYTISSGRVVVETREAALTEAGDLLLAIDEGKFAASDIVADLRELARGVLARRTPEDITVFKSVGVAFEDLVLARAVVDLATETGSRCASIDSLS